MHYEILIDMWVNFVAVTGPSGSGKTTFLSIAGLLETFNGGTYELDGQDVSNLNEKNVANLETKRLASFFKALI
jgi:putative ABC transport system ATP-binding protein